jgi:hypothetical protein
MDNVKTIYKLQDNVASMYFQYLQIIYYYRKFESINVDKIVKTKIQDKQVNVVSTSCELLFKFIVFENLN